MSEANEIEITRSWTLLCENADLRHFKKITQPKAVQFGDKATVKGRRATVQPPKPPRNSRLLHQMPTV